MSGNLNHLFSEESNKVLARLMLYGRPKMKKTWWAGKAAEDGFNVILLDGDNGFQILRNINETGKTRLSRVACHDRIGDPVFAPYIIRLLKQKKMFWDETERKPIISMSAIREDHDYSYLDLNKLTSRDVLVLDSFTRLCTSINMRYAVENNIDMSDAEKWEWEGYAYGGMLVDWILNSLSAIPCHVIVIGHSTVYEKYEGRGRDRTLVSSTTVMKSTSGPKSMTVPTDFSDILFFEKQGNNFRINTRSEPDRIGGCRGIEPNIYEWDKLQFRDIAKQYGIPIPDPNREYDCDAFQYFPAGTTIPEGLVGGKPQPKQPIGNQEAAPAKISLLNKE